MEHRMKELRNTLGYTLEEFYELSNPPTGFDNFKRVERGERTLQIDVAIAITSKYGVSLDWLYKQSEEINSKDTMINIVFALSKIFNIAVRSTRYSNKDIVLLIEERFGSFIRDIRDFEYHTSKTEFIDKQTYNNGRKKLFEKHKGMLQELFGEATFTEGGSLEIYGIESKSYSELNDTILNYLS